MDGKIIPTSDMHFSITKKLTPYEQQVLSDKIITVRKYFNGLIAQLVARCIPTIIMHANGQLENRWPPQIQKNIDAINACCEQHVKTLLKDYA